MGRNTGLLRTGKVCVMCLGENKRRFVTCKGRGGDTTVIKIGVWEIWRLFSDCMV